MKAIALLARKGGAGKTTIAIHAAIAAERDGLRVLLFDLDPQASLAAWWQAREGEYPPLIQTDARRLPELLKAAEAEGYDLAVIDTPPAVSNDTALVAAAADLVLIPLRPSILDVLAVESTAAVVKPTNTPAVLILNACIAPTQAGEAPTTAQAREALASIGVPVAVASLAQRLDYSRALNEGQAVTEFAPESRAAEEIGRLWQEIRRSI